MTNVFWGKKFLVLVPHGVVIMDKWHEKEIVTFTSDWQARVKEIKKDKGNFWWIPIVEKELSDEISIVDTKEKKINDEELFKADAIIVSLPAAKPMGKYLKEKAEELGAEKMPKLFVTHNIKRIQNKDGSTTIAGSEGLAEISY